MMVLHQHFLYHCLESIVSCCLTKLLDLCLIGYATLVLAANMWLLFPLYVMARERASYKMKGATKGLPASKYLAICKCLH